jgi:MFS family permease
MNDSVQYPSFRWLILIAVVLTNITVQVTNLSISPVLPQVAESLDIDIGVATNLMSAFLFSGCIMLVFVGGIICDRFGILTSVILGLLCLSIPGALMPWIGTSYGAVFWARIVQGLASGFAFPAMGAVIAFWFPFHEKGLAGGLMGAAVAVGSAIGLTGGPVIFRIAENWQMMSMWLSLIGCVALLYAVILAVIPKKQLSPQSQTEEKQSGGGVFERALFSPLTWLGIGLTFMAAWGMQCLYGLTATFLSADKPIGAGYGPMLSGQLMLGVTIAGIVGPVIGGLLLDKVFKGNTKTIMLLGFALMCVFIYALITPWVSASIPVLVIALALAGLGVQFVFPNIYVFVAKAYSPQIVGKMTGLWMGLGTFGGVIGLYLGGITVNKFGNYNMALTLMALSALVGFILVFILARLNSVEEKDSQQVTPLHPGHSQELP